MVFSEGVRHELFCGPMCGFRSAAPALEMHSGEILAMLGLDANALDELLRQPQ